MSSLSSLKRVRKTPPVPVLLGTASQIWTFLQAEGGLDLEFHADMDEKIAEELREKLGPPAEANIDAALAHSPVTVETFVEAFLSALGPYSVMMADLLRMFETAGGKRTDHALRAHFDFGQKLALDFDIRQFRDWMETLKMVRQAVEIPAMDVGHLSTLWTLLREWAPDWRGSMTSVAPEGIAEWLNVYYERRLWPTFEVPSPVSRDKAIERQLRRVHTLWLSAVHAMQSFGPDRTALHRAAFSGRLNDVTVEGWSVGRVGAIDHDHWAGAILELMYDIAAKSPDGIASALERFFAGVPIITVDRETLRRTLLEFLNLPIWKRRHELFSAWIATQILDAVSEYEPRIHVRDDLISFAFGGSHLATLDGTRPAVHLWAELRSPVDATLTKKEKNIQPDYTLVADPVTSPRSAVVVVECKQYRQESRENFGHAVYKYCIGRPGAAIVLVNYGQARMSILDGLPLTPEQLARIRIFGDVRPGAASLVDFHTAISDALGERCPRTVPAAAAAPVSARHNAVATLTWIELLWPSTVSDLDLHLLLDSGNEISYSSRGSLAAEPWATLDTDAQSGGKETIDLGRTLPTRYRCFVHNFSNEAPVRLSAAVVRAEYGRSHLEIGVPVDGEGRYWHVFDYDGRSGAITLVNALTDERPTFGTNSG